MYNQDVKPGKIEPGCPLSGFFLTLVSSYNGMFMELVTDKNMQADLINKKEFSGHFEALFLNATMSIFFTDMKGIIKAVNPFALKEFGYATAEELTGKEIEVLIPYRNRSRYEAYLQEYFQNPGILNLGKHLDPFALRKDGTEFPAEISLSHYTYNAHQYIIVFLNNISAKKIAETKFEELNSKLEIAVDQRTKELTAALEELKKSKEKLEVAGTIQKTVLENAGAIIISTNPEGIIQSFNPAAEECSGYKAEEVIGKITPIAFRCPEELQRRAVQFSKELSEHIEPGFETYVAKAKRNIQQKDEWIFVRKDGSRFPVSLIVTALRNKNGGITGYIGVSVDISELKREEENLRQSLQEEKELNELKSRFVSMASHEFRTPLSTVLSSAYLIEKYKSVDDQPKREKHLQRIISSVNILTDILNDFLDVGKIEEGKIYTKISEFDVQRLVSSIAEEIQHTMKCGQLIHYEHEGKKTVMLDSSLLRHIIMNLISNAGKFSGENCPVEIKTVHHNGMLQLTVKDCGIGISREDQKHLMERFFRGANAANVQGTGLGLHIVAKYTELMNGKIEWKSDLGKGTEFIITIDTKTGVYEKDFAD